MPFLVKAPLVLAHDRDGKVRYHYADHVIPWLSDEQAAHFTKLGLIEEVEADTAAAPPQPAPDSQAAPADDRPLKSAPESDWRKYAVEKHGVTEEDAAKLSRQDLIELYGG